MLQIRVLGYTRVTKSFDARRLCDRRRYEYILPAFAFDPGCCCGGGAPLAHVGAAGNVVEKHAGGELDLEAALDRLPAAGQQGSMQRNAGAQESSKLQQQQQHQTTYQIGGEVDPGTVPCTASVGIEMKDSHAAKGNEQRPLGPQQQQHGDGGSMAAQHSKNACEGEDHRTSSLSAQPGAESLLGTLPAEQKPPPAAQCSSTHISQSTKAVDTVLGQCDTQHPSSNGTAPLLHSQIKQPEVHSAPGSGEQPSRKPPGGGAAERHAACSHVPAEYRRVRFTAEQQARLSKVLAGYEGTHNFHNYTVRVAAGNPAAMRYILSFKCAGTMEIQARTYLSIFIQGLACHIIRMLSLLHIEDAFMRLRLNPEASWSVSWLLERTTILCHLERRNAILVYIVSRLQLLTCNLQGQEWVRMVVLGQSFMLHQIRKLVGTAVAVMRGDAPPECIQLALQPERHMVRPTSLCQKHAESCSL